MFGGANKSKSSLEINIPIIQVAKLIFLITAIYLCFILRDVLMLLFISFVIMAAAKTAAEVLQKWFRLPRGISIILTYMSFISLLGLTLYFVTQPLASEFNNLSANTPTLVNELSERFPFLTDRLNEGNLTNLFQSIFSDIGNTVGNTLSITFNAFGAIIQVISVIILSIYLLLERDSTIRFFLKSFNLNEDNFYTIYNKVETQVGAWVRGQIILAFAVGIFTYVGLVAIGFKYALPLAVLAGLFEIIPFIGPIIAAIPIILIGFSISPITGLLGLILTIIVQQLENHILVPVIMKRAVGLSPVVTIISVLIGSKLFGILGTIIAVPVAAVVSSLINIYLEAHNQSLLQTTKKL